MSLVSIGTERMLIEFGKANLLQKALRHPDRVRQAIDKMRTDGIGPTVAAVRSKLDQSIPLGNANLGTVVELGEGVSDLCLGDRVVSNGAHAEWVCVPRNLCMKVPPGVEPGDVVFAMVGAIGLQGVRLLDPTLGESIAVIGLGLIGLLAVQILKANGCRVIGIDKDARRCSLAQGFGAEAVDLSDPSATESAVSRFSRGRGVDGVLITASTSSNQPVEMAPRMCRQRGRIVLVGVVGMGLNRNDFYEKEISFQVSCSFGPGRYDDSYERLGRDYPLGFVRWTEQRNVEAMLDLISSGALALDPLISHRVPFARALEVYQEIGSGEALGVLLEYPHSEKDQRQVGTPERRLTVNSPRARSKARPVIGVLGAGNFAFQVLLPALAKTGARLKTVVSATGVSAARAARKFGFEGASSERDDVFGDDEIDAVLIATRHVSHGHLVECGLQSGKSIFVEKPLCLTESELEAVERALGESSDPLLTVGFNRRFAPHTAKIKALIECTSAPKAFILTVNAGALPSDHWLRSDDQGGGRILGEACHYIDLLRHLAQSPIHHYQAAFARENMGVTDEVVTITLSFADGSLGTIHYFANGHRRFPKERLEVFCDGRVLQLDNFRSLRGMGWPGFRQMRLRSQDKGHSGEMKAFLESVACGGPPPIPLDEILEVTRVTLAINHMRRGGAMDRELTIPGQ